MSAKSRYCKEGEDFKKKRESIAWAQNEWEGKSVHGVNGGNVDFFGFRLGVTEQHPIDGRVYRSLSGSEVHVKLLLKALSDLALGDRV